MQTALHIKTRVLPGNRVEIVAPGLQEGEPIDVFLVTERAPSSQGRSILEFLDSLPPGPRLFTSWDELDRHLEEERNSWDR